MASEGPRGDASEIIPSQSKRPVILSPSRNRRRERIIDEPTFTMQTHSLDYPLRLQAPEPEPREPSTLMSNIAAAANRDTPESVTVSPTVQSLTQYMVTKLGVAAIGFGMMWIFWTAYQQRCEADIKSLQDQLVVKDKQIDSYREMVQTMDRALKMTGQK